MNKDDEEILNDRVRLAMSIKLSKVLIKCPNCKSENFDGSDCMDCGFDVYSYDPYDK